MMSVVHNLVPLAIAAPFVGSFLGTLVLRIPAGEPVVFAHSACVDCGRRLRPYELVPLLSWCLQKGRCRACRASISVFYPLIEIAALFVVAWAAAVTSEIALAFTCGLGWILLALSVMDIVSYKLSDALTGTLAVLGFIAVWRLVPEQFAAHLLGGVLGITTFTAVAYAYKILRGRDGMGAGDAKLLGAGGIWVGLGGLASVILLASFAALGTLLFARLAGRQLNATTMLPFGPFLALGIWIVWLYGPLELRL